MNTIEISKDFLLPRVKYTFSGDLVELSWPKGHDHWTAKLYIDQASAYLYPTVTDQISVLLSRSGEIGSATVEAGALVWGECSAWIPIRGSAAAFKMACSFTM